MNVSIKGEEGETSTLPFGIHYLQPSLPKPYRPVWVLAEHAPKFAGSVMPPVAPGPRAQKTFDFGALKKGATAKSGSEAERSQDWQLHASLRRSRPGSPIKPRPRPAAE